MHPEGTNFLTQNLGVDGGEGNLFFDFFLFFDCSDHYKTLGPESWLFTLDTLSHQEKLIYTHMAHQNPSKTGIFMSKSMFLRGFGVPYVCKSIFLGETMFLM